MKSLVILLTTLMSQTLFAGTATSWENDALGFTIIATPSSDQIEICNIQDTCLNFNRTNDLERVTEYTEVSGKCKITMELVDHDHSNSGDSFMMTLTYQVVRVKEGEENCKMKGASTGPRSLKGIYL